MDIWNIALGFMDSQILFAADELGVFKTLDERPRTTDEIAQAAGLSPDAAERMLTMLCSLKLVRKTKDGRFANSRRASQQLVPGKPGYIGGMFRHLKEDLYPVWRYCREALVEECAQWEREASHNGGRRKNEEMFENPEALRAFMNGMHTLAYGAGLELAEQAPALRRIRSIADIGGAAGSFLIALAQRLPRIQGTIMDLPHVQPIAEEFIRAHGLDGRLQFRPGDFFHDPVPEGMDAYSLGYILHDWSTDAGTQILNKIADASRPGALLIVGEFLLEDDRTGPLFVARSDLNMLVAACGRERTAREYDDWFRRSGFRLRNVHYTRKAGKVFLLAKRE